jgi:tetratricopeptide (TPR) repeat protein
MNIKRLVETSLLLVLLVGGSKVQAQRDETRSGGNHILYGDVSVAEAQATSLKPISLDVLLYTESGNLVSRQTVPSNGRYRFNNLTDGRYEIVVEIENTEVARFKIDFSSRFITDLRQDIPLSWHESSATNGGGTISAADIYNRPAKNVAVFNEGLRARAKKNYDDALILFGRIVHTDPKDFPAWEEVGTIQFIKKNFDEAEKAYVEALKLHPNYELVLISLGRLRIAQRNFEGAVELLTQGVKVEPKSAQANYFLGEAYLQLKKGSKAIGYLYEALRIDPVGMAEAHLRLAALFHGAGMKGKAATEYEEFLKKVPDYEDKKRLEEYIAANKKH